MSKTILVIEDDAFLRGLMVRKIVEEGFNASEAETGEQGTEKAKKEKPDLILLDLMLPDISGFDVLKRLKEDQSAKSIPVIILSNLAAPEEIENGLKIGATDYLVKAHLTPREIIEKVKLILK